MSCGLRNMSMMFIWVLAFTVSAPLFTSPDKTKAIDALSSTTLTHSWNRVIECSDESNLITLRDAHCDSVKTNNGRGFEEPVFLKANKLRLLLMSILIHYKYDCHLDNHNLDDRLNGLPVDFSNSIQISLNRTNLLTVQKRR
jgi:hypothetical protein